MADYDKRAVADLRKALKEVDGTNKVDVLTAVRSWGARVGYIELEVKGATGKELREVWERWPPGESYYIEDCVGLEDDLGNWIVDDEAFFLEEDIEDFGGYVLPQGTRADHPLEGTPWEGKSFADLWRWCRENPVEERHKQVLTTKDRNGNVIPPTCAHCGEAEKRCEGRLS